MRAKLGIALMLAGVLMLAGSVGLLVHNTQEQTRANESVSALMPQIVEVIRRAPQTPIHETARRAMKTTEIDGNEYIGFLGIPALSLELPVMADWSDAKLKLAPCRYTGDLHTDDLVIMAHNYRLHFGRLSELREGDTITFTDLDAVTTEYRVAALDVLAETDIEAMSSGEYALTLFTCTYSGKDRVTVRCDRADG